MLTIAFLLTCAFAQTPSPSPAPNNCAPYMEWFEGAKCFKDSPETLRIDFWMSTLATSAAIITWTAFSYYMAQSNWRWRTETKKHTCWRLIYMGYNLYGEPSVDIDFYIDFFLYATLLWIPVFICKILYCIICCSYLRRKRAERRALAQQPIILV